MDEAVVKEMLGLQDFDLAIESLRGKNFTLKHNSVNIETEYAGQTYIFEIDILETKTVSGCGDCGRSSSETYITELKLISVNGHDAPADSQNKFYDVFAWRGAKPDEPSDLPSVEPSALIYIEEYWDGDY